MLPLNVSLLGLANHLWQSTLFVALVGALTLWLRRNRAAVRYRLWLIASVKFLVPFALLTGIGSQLGWHPMQAFPQSGVPVAIQQISQPFVVPPSSLQAPPSVQAPASLPSGVSPVAVILGGMWIIGSAIVLLMWWRQRSRVARVVRNAEAFESSGHFNPELTAKRIPILSSPEGMEPGVFGIFRPVLLLPEGVARNLSGRQLESIVAHEMAHVRGRDNLASALHTIVEATFWFHPLVWWLGNRLLIERERACDEAVLQLGCDPADYAEGILKICKSYLTAPACMAGISGINLKNRIEAIMENRRAPHLTVGKKLLLTLAAAGAIAVPLLTGITDAAETPQASVRAVPAVVTPIPEQSPASQATGQDPSPTQNKWPAVVQHNIQVANPPQNKWPVNVAWVIQAANLPQDKWLNEVAYISTNDERNAFSKLATDEERRSFIVNFWLVRDPTPGTPTNEFKDEYYARIAYANDHFSQPGLPGSKTDRGRMYILNGPPDEIVSHSTGGAYNRPSKEGGGTTYTFPFETWRYRHLGGKGDNMIYEFVDRGSGDYRLEYDPAAKEK
jgi:GWxTD domain-containing protein